MDIIEIIDETYMSVAHSNSVMEMLQYRVNAPSPLDNGIDIGFFVLDHLWSFR